MVVSLLFVLLCLLDRLPGHLSEVSIRDTDTQPDSPIKFRRDQTRTLVASFNLENLDSGQASFYWRITQLALSPLDISDKPELLVHDTIELNIGPKLLLKGLKLVVFELQISGLELAARDFAFLKIDEAALVASITGGTEVLRSSNKPIYVDGSSSYDPESEDGTLLGMIFNWSCFIDGHNNVSGFNNTVTVSISGNVFNTLDDSAANGTLYQLPDDVLLHGFGREKMYLDTTKLISNNTYYVLLTVRKETRTATAVQTVHIHDGELVDIRIM